MSNAMPESPRLPSFQFCWPRLTRARLFGGLACLLGAGIAGNAMWMQSEKHPAPMFRTLAKPAPMKVDVPLPPLRGEVREASEKAPALAPRADKTLPAAAPLVDPLLFNLQTELATRGYYKGEADGRGGPATSKAIRDFQFDRRLAVDGVPSETLLGEVRATKLTPKDELLDIVKRASEPEKPAKKPEKKSEAAPPAAKPVKLASVPAKTDKAKTDKAAPAAAKKDATKAAAAPKAQVAKAQPEKAPAKVQSTKVQAAKAPPPAKAQTAKAEHDAFAPPRPKADVGPAKATPARVTVAEAKASR